jgi:hypothetical protein
LHSTRQRLAARLIALASVQARLGHGLERPVIRFGRHHDRDADGCLDDPVVSRAASFQQADRGLRIFAETAGNGAAGGPAADDNVIEFFHLHSPRMDFVLVGASAFGSTSSVPVRQQAWT